MDKNINFHTDWLHYTHCFFQIIFSYTNTSLFILLNCMQNPFYTRLVFVFLNSSSFSLLISLLKTWSHCWKWHMALHEKLTQPGKCLQGNNSSPPALIAQCLPPRYCSWNLCSRAEPATPPRTVLWLLGSRVGPPLGGLFTLVKNAGKIGERASLTYFFSSSHPFPSYTHISAPTSKLHIHPRISGGWWKKRSVGNKTLKSSNIFLHVFASVEKLRAGDTMLHFSVSGEQKKR